MAGPWRIFTALPYSPIRRVCKFHSTSAPEPFAYSIVMDILYHILACFANFFCSLSGAGFSGFSGLGFSLMGRVSPSACLCCLSRGDRPRAAEKKRCPFTVGRGPVPRHASRTPTIAGETLSDARVASEGPRATVIVAVLNRPRAAVKKRLLHVGRGPVPRHQSRAERSRGRPSRMRVWHPRAPALREHRDQRSLLRYCIEI